MKWVELFYELKKLSETLLTHPCPYLTDEEYAHVLYITYETWEHIAQMENRDPHFKQILFELPMIYLRVSEKREQAFSIG